MKTLFYVWIVLVQLLLFAVTFILLASILAVFILRNFYLHRHHQSTNTDRRSPTIGFLHPYAFSGGGGERVLWSAIQATRNAYPHSTIVLYCNLKSPTSSDSNTNLFRSKIQSQFGLDLLSSASTLNLQMVDISDISWLADSSTYPRLTLLLQAFGMCALGLRSFSRRPVHVFIDTANLPFALLIPRLILSPSQLCTMAYVHYPTISTDMLEIVKRRQVDVHNTSNVAKSTWKTYVKLCYYRGFAKLYAVAANQGIDVAIANSTWTARHLQAIWGSRGTRNEMNKIQVVFPPCPVSLPSSSSISKQNCLIVSVGQFRHEKRHDEQIRIMKQVVRTHPKAKLTMIGGARHDADKTYVAHLQTQIKNGGLQKNVSLHVNIDRNALQEWIQRADIGLHTMRYEHFGIGVVELMNAGVVTIAHRSGGVETDILKDGRNGMLADDEQGFVTSLRCTLDMDAERKCVIRKNAQESSVKFSEKEFQSGFLSALRNCIVDGLAEDG